MRFITLGENNVVMNVRYGSEIVPGEIESALGDPGQIMQEDGTFKTPEQVEPVPTEQELVNAELLLGQAHLAESNAAIEETVAMILLETVGGGA